MSDKKPPTPPPTANQGGSKMKLSDLLKRVELIADGRDKEGRAPDDAGHDAASAPSVPMRWTASVLKILIGRTIDYARMLLETRAALRDPALKDDEPWRSDIPKIREQLAEQSQMLGMIVAAVERAQGGAPAPAGAGDAVGGDPEAAEEPVAEPGDAAAQAELDALAAAMAKGKPVDLSKVTAIRSNADGKAPPAPKPPTAA